MSLLAPLYALGVLAISLPVIFHLIQRRPRSELVFSSLMFLSPSPPRLTRRSRLNHLLLLLLRGSAIVLLAFAFARPFLRGTLLSDQSPAGQRVLLLMDTSASMRREGLWEQAQSIASQVVQRLHPADQLAILTFDNTVRIPLGFGTNTQSRQQDRQSLATETLERLQPTWGATALDSALATAVDQLREATDAASQPDRISTSQIILITDLQQGAAIDSLRSFSWPAEVRLDLRLVKPVSSTNASLDQLPRIDAGATTPDSVRIRVTNSEASQTDRFRIGWVIEDAQLDQSTLQTIQVPAGQSRVISIQPHAVSRELRLEGDDDRFDNRLYVAQPEKKQQTILYLGPEEEDGESPLYFLKRAALDTANTQVDISVPSTAQPLAAIDSSPTPFVVVDRPLSTSEAESLRADVEGGGHVLVLLSRESGVASAEGLRQLLRDETLQIVETELTDYAMFRQIDFQHPLFMPFANPQFNDFTKIRFWSHRRLTSSADDENTPSWTLLADFDDGDPALVEQVSGKGRIWILTTSWATQESQLALSTKFIPLLAGMLRLAVPGNVAAEYAVDQRVILEETEAVVVLPDGEEISVQESPYTLNRTQQPGIYRVKSTSGKNEFAVNIAAEESRTDAMDPVELERRGVRVGRAMTTAQLEQQKKLARDTELESRQQIWRWLIATTLVVLAIETFLAGRLTRRQTPVESDTGSDRDG